MRLSGLHLLLTYQCTLECDHCFVWGSPWQTGTMTLHDIRHIMEQASDLGTIPSVYFEGGEPFLYYGTLLKAVEMASHLGFQVGIVSNSYWATSVEDAVEWLRPFAGLVQDLSISSDVYHWSEEVSRQSQNAQAAAQQLGIPIGVMSVAQPEATNAASVVGQLPIGESAVMYRGRARRPAWKRAHLSRHCHRQPVPHAPEGDLRDVRPGCASDRRPLAQRWTCGAGAPIRTFACGDLRRRMSSLRRGPPHAARTIPRNPDARPDVW